MNKKVALTVAVAQFGTSTQIGVEEFASVQSPVSPQRRQSTGGRDPTTGQDEDELPSSHGHEGRTWGRGKEREEEANERRRRSAIGSPMSAAPNPSRWDSVLLSRR